MGIKKVKLNYKPIAPIKNDEIAYEVSRDHVEEVTKNIKQKLQRNAIERHLSTIEAANFHVGKSLIKKKY